LKFLCASCQRLGEVERFRLDGPALVVTCTQCGAESRASHSGPSVAPAPAPPPPSNVTTLRTPTVEAIARAARAADEPIAVPEGRCPKCISKRLTDAPACPSCGMVFSQADVTSFTPSAELETAWRALLAQWGDDGRHEAFRAAAMNKGELAGAGRLYRLRLADQPDDPWAARGRDEVLRLAVLPQLTVRQVKVEGQVPVWKYVVLSAVIVVCLITIFVLVRQMLATS